MKIALALYPGLTLLDVIGPYQALALLPEDDVVLCAERRGRLSDDNGLVHLDVEHTFDDVQRPDVVLVGGGAGSRPLERPDSAIVEWIAQAHPHTVATTSVCTGALLLGAAGVLQGRRATTHWRFLDRLAEHGAHPVEERVVTDGKVVTAAGVSAGIDMALTLVDRLRGAELSQAIQLGIEYDPAPPHDTGSAWTAPEDLVALVRAVMDADEATGTDLAGRG